MEYLQSQTIEQALSYLRASHNVTCGCEVLGDTAYITVYSCEVLYAFGRFIPLSEVDGMHAKDICKLLSEDLEAGISDYLERSK